MSGNIRRVYYQYGTYFTTTEGSRRYTEVMRRYMGQYLPSHCQGQRLNPNVLISSR